MSKVRSIPVLVLRVTGLLIIGFSIYIANYVGNTSDLYLVFEQYTQMVALVVGFIGVASGIAFLGKAEKVKLLHNIYTNISSNKYEARNDINNKNAKELDNWKRGF